MYVNCNVVSICCSICESLVWPFDVLMHLQIVGRTYGDLRAVSSSFKPLFLNTSTKREVFSVVWSIMIPRLLRSRCDDGPKARLVRSDDKG